MGFARFSVTRPVAVMMRIFALVILGVICLQKLSVDLLPKVSIPTVAVITTWQNVPPSQMETQITRPVEEACSQVPNLYEIDSSSTVGQSSVRLQFQWGTNIDTAAIDTIEYAQRAKQQFPQDPTNTLQNPLVYKFDPSSLPILILGVTGIDDPVRLVMLLNNTITPILESSEGVASAVATGGLTRSIMVNVDPVKLQAYHIPLQLISQEIASQNISLPSGIGKMGDTEYTIQATGYFNSVDDIRNMPLGIFSSGTTNSPTSTASQGSAAAATPGTTQTTAPSPGQEVLLKDVASVDDSYEEQRIVTRLNGKPACGVIIIEQSNANTVSAVQAVETQLKKVNQLYPELKWTKAYDESVFISDSVNDLKNTALIGGLLAVLILMLFLRNVRSTMVVALSIPISIFSTFSLFYFCGFTLNTISLSGLALATGLIVDDAVVVMENIFRHIERDKRRSADGAMVGTAEIASAVLASTFTVMIVFLPLMMIQGQAGQTFTQFALVVIFSMAVSWLDAMTVVPMLCSRLISEQEVLEEFHPELRTKKPSALTRVFDWFGAKFNALDRSYHRGLQWSLDHRGLVLLGAGGAVASTFILIPFIGTEMLPQTDTGNFTITIKLPVGTALTTTDAVMQKVEKIVLNDPDVQSEFSASGTTLSLRGTTTAQIGYEGGSTVTLKDNRKHSTQENIVMIQKQLAKIPGILALVTPYDIVTQILTGGSTNMEVDVFGQNYDDVTKAARIVQQKMSAVPGMDAVDLGVQEATPMMEFNVDRDEAMELGLNYNDLANAVNTATNGELSSYYQELGFQYPIYVQLPLKDRKTGAEILNLPVTSFTNASGAVASTTLLKQVASITYPYGPNQITRLNRQRYIAVTGRVVPGRSISEAQTQIGEALKGVNLGNGIYWDWGLNNRRQGQEFAGLGLAVFMAISLIYIVLASQFESYVYPLIVLTSVPLCGIGVVLALFITGRNFGLTAFIGLLMLIGIAVKNGILLVDYTNQLRSKGMSRNAAILQAGPTRLRPILMTSSAAILGMLPLALQIGRGSETESPLATAVVGGLFTSTILTLFVVPVVYTLFDDLAHMRRGKIKGAAPADLIGPSFSTGRHSNGSPLEGSKESTGGGSVGSEWHE